MRIVTFHNIATDLSGRPAGMLDGYKPGHALVPVFRHDLPEALNPFTVADIVFRLFNVGDDPEFGTPDPRAVMYREWGNRSLSVGDVLHIAGGTTEGGTVADAVWLACASSGWDEIAAPQFFARNASAPGSKALNREFDLTRRL